MLSETHATAHATHKITKTTNNKQKNLGRGVADGKGAGQHGRRRAREHEAAALALLDEALEEVVRDLHGAAGVALDVGGHLLGRPLVK